MKMKDTAAFLGAFLLIAAFPGTSDAEFVFSRIADSTQGYSNFSLPSVNSSGVVAFRADATTSAGANVTGIFTGTGGAVATDYTTNDPLHRIATDPAINELSQISFDLGTPMPGGIMGISVVRLSGTSLTSIYFSSLEIPTSTAIANNGTVFFSATGPAAGNHATFGSGNGGPVSFYVGPDAGGSAGRAAVNSLGQGAVEHGGAIVGSGAR